jgi:hypothetical protein
VGVVMAANFEQSKLLAEISSTFMPANRWRFLGMEVRTVNVNELVLGTFLLHPNVNNNGPDMLDEPKLSQVSFRAWKHPPGICWTPSSKR